LKTILIGMLKLLL